AVPGEVGREHGEAPCELGDERRERPRGERRVVDEHDGWAYTCAAVVHLTLSDRYEPSPLRRAHRLPGVSTSAARREQLRSGGRFPSDRRMDGYNHWMADPVFWSQRKLKPCSVIRAARAVLSSIERE